MIIQKQSRKQVIDLNGPQGNAFYLLGSAKQFHKDLTRFGIELPSIESIQSEMTSGDYENLILVFDKYFGNYIDLER